MLKRCVYVSRSRSSMNMMPSLDCFYSFLPSCQLASSFLCPNEITQEKVTSNENARKPPASVGSRVHVGVSNEISMVLDPSTFYHRLTKSEACFSYWKWKRDDHLHIRLKMFKGERIVDGRNFVHLKPGLCYRNPENELPNNFPLISNLTPSSLSISTLSSTLAP